MQLFSYLGIKSLLKLTFERVEYSRISSKTVEVVSNTGTITGI